MGQAVRLGFYRREVDISAFFLDIKTSRECALQRHVVCGGSGYGFMGDIE